MNKPKEDPVKSEDPPEGHMLSEGNMGWTACPSESSRKHTHPSTPGPSQEKAVCVDGCLASPGDRHFHQP